MVDPRTPQVPPPLPSGGGRVRTGVAVAVTRGRPDRSAAPPGRPSSATLPRARVTLQAASPALVNGGPVATSYADLVQTVSPAVVAVRSSRMVQQTSFGPDNPFRRFFGDDDNARAAP